MKNRKRLARDVPDTFATHAGRINDMTDTDCQRQNGSTHGFVFLQLSDVSFELTRPEIM